MNVSLKWLNDYLDRPTDFEESDRLLTNLGFPLDDGTEELESGDMLMDVEVTSNRGDCLSHIGVAREVAAASGRTLKKPEIQISESDSSDVNDLTSVVIDTDAADLCPLYTARVIKGVKVGPSPDWMVKRLEAVGLRSVNNVVDVTNFVLFETGQPLHAFDMNLLHDRRIVVRKATEGEQFTAIDGTEHKLRGDMLVIADADRPVAVAGVMGGLDSEVGEQTTDILLESATFEALSVRTTSRALKLSSDSSYRFERGVDPYGIDRASRRAAQLILELAGGELAKGVITVGKPLPEPTSVSLRPERCNQILGYELTQDQMIELLNSLGLQATDNDGVIVCEIPSFRLDLTREIDLIEEIARLNGYDEIAVESTMPITVRGPQPSVEARKRVNQVMVSHGYHETITFSTTSEAAAKPFVPSGHELIIIQDDQKKAAPAMRPSVVPSLLACRKSNQDAGNHDVRLFEIASTYSSAEGEFDEQRRLTILIDAENAGDALRSVRGTIEELYERMGRSEAVSFEKAEQSLPWTDQAGVVKSGDQVVGTYGRVTDSIAKQFGLQVPVVAAELDYTFLAEGYPNERAVHALPKFPVIERDLSIIVDETVSWADIERLIRSSNPGHLEDIQFVMVYRGKPIAKGRKSVTLRMTFRHPDRTLQHDEVTEQVDPVIASLQGTFKAELRA